MSLILDGTNGLTFNNATTQNSGGKILQVVNAVLTTASVSSVSSTLADTGLTATITPLFSTSKILVLVDMGGCDKTGANTYMKLVLNRGATGIYNMESQAGYNTVTTENSFGACSCNYLDSPATTSATTYKVQFSNVTATGTVYVNVGSGSNSSITLMEIAA